MNQRLLGAGAVSAEKILNTRFICREEKCGTKRSCRLMINPVRVGMPMYGKENALAYDSLRKVNALRPRMLYSGHGRPVSGNQRAQYFEMKGLSPERVSL